MTVIQFKRPVPMSPRKKTARKATLTVVSYVGKPKDAPMGSGILRIGSLELTHPSPIILGTAAAIAGAGRVLLIAAGLPEGGLVLTLTKRMLQVEEHADLSIGLFIRQFRTGLDVAKNSKRHSQWLVERCESEHWQAACALVPEELRCLDGLEHGIYGPDGYPLSARKIAAQAQSNRVMSGFISAMDGHASGVVADNGFDMTDVLRLTGDRELDPVRSPNDDPVVYTGKSEFVMRGLIARYGFARLPLTYGELLGFLDYRDMFDLINGESIARESWHEDWQKAGFKVLEKHYPERVAAAKLYFKGDLEGLQALHKRESTLELLGANELPEELPE